MKPYTIVFTDRDGQKVQKGFRNGIKETLLVEPSQWYKDNVLKPKYEANRLWWERQEKEEKIQRKIREIAERELEKEGKL